MKKMDDAICRFLEALDQQDYRIHTLMVSRGEKIIYESAAEPYTLDTPHRLFSSAKSILVLSALRAMQDGYLKPEDHVVDYFPEYQVTDPGLKKMTVDDLLTMRTGQVGDPFGLVIGDLDADLIEAFFQTPTVEDPGKTFRYNNTVPHIVYAVTERAVGVPFEMYQNRHFCEPLDAPLLAPTNSKGQYNPVVTCTSARSFMKYAQLFLGEGMWGGHRYLDTEYIREATRPHTSTGMTGHASHYAWQIWENEFGGYRMDGGWGQFAFVLPEENTAVTVTSDMTDCSYLIEAFEKELLPAIRETEQESGGRETEQVPSDREAEQRPGSKPQLASLAPRAGRKMAKMENIHLTGAPEFYDVFREVNAQKSREADAQDLSTSPTSPTGKSVKAPEMTLQLKNTRRNTVILRQNDHQAEIGLDGAWIENNGYQPRAFSVDHSVYGVDDGYDANCAGGKVYLSGAWTAPNVFEFTGKCFAEMGETYARLRFEGDMCYVVYTPLAAHGIAARAKNKEEMKEVVLCRRQKAE